MVTAKNVCKEIISRHEFWNDVSSFHLSIVQPMTFVWMLAFFLLPVWWSQLSMLHHVNWKRILFACWNREFPALLDELVRYSAQVTEH